MAKSALLIFEKSDESGASINTLPPLGILGVASFLETREVRTDVIDFNVQRKAEIRVEDYDLIGFSLNISNREESLRRIAKLRESARHCRIVVGGPVCMCAPEQLFNNKDIDAIFGGEGEHALFEYLTFEKSEDVRGIYVNNGETFQFTRRREWFNDLDELPFPALKKVDIARYTSCPKKRAPVSSIMTSRGCPFGCIFCSHAMGRKWRPRSSTNVLEEIEWQVRELGVREICVYDDNFSMDKRRAEEICDGIVEKSIDVSLQFSNGLRVDSLDESLLRKLRAAGTWLLGIAPETGNSSVMEQIRKGFDHKKVGEVRRLCREIGITTHGFFMIGFPFETRDNILETIAYAISLDCDLVEFNKVIPYPKTELYEMITREGRGVIASFAEVKSYHTGEITTHRVGDLKPGEVRDLIRMAYRRYFMRPRKVWNLMQSFSPGDLVRLGLYALRTQNV